MKASLILSHLALAGGAVAMFYVGRGSVESTDTSNGGLDVESTRIQGNSKAPVLDGRSLAAETGAADSVQAVLDQLSFSKQKISADMME